MTKKHYLIIIVLFSIFISYFLVNNFDDNTDEKDNSTQVIDRGDVLTIKNLENEMKKAQSSGDIVKANEIKNKINALMPPQMQKVYDLVTDNIYKISFVGKVLDQNSVPVSNAEIEFTSVGMYNLTQGERGTAKTDASGIFEIESEGYGLILNAPEHPEIAEAFFPPAELTTSLRKSLIFRPNSNEYDDWSLFTINNPFTISVWRQEVFQNIKQGGGINNLTPDGIIHTLIDSAYLGNSSASGVFVQKGILDDGYLYFSCTREGVADDRHIVDPGDWNITITATDGGGIQKTDDIYLNMAPLDGYLSSITEGRIRSQPDYLKLLPAQSYYFTADNGRVYGSLIISYMPFVRKNRCIVDIQYKINSDNSEI